MFHFIYYSVTIRESKVKFGIVFCCFAAIKKNILTLPSSSNFAEKLIFCVIVTFVCQDKSISVKL